MRIRRAHEPSHFTMMANEVIRDYRLSCRARGLHHDLVSRPDGDETTLEDIWKEMRAAGGDAVEGYQALRSAYRELIRYRYIVVERHQDERGRWRTMSTVYSRPQGEAPTSDNGAKPQVGPSDGNRVYGDRVHGDGARKNKEPGKKPVPPSADASTTRRPDPGNADRPHGTQPAREAPVTAQTILGGYLAGLVKRPPRRVVGHLGRLVGEMLADGIDPDDVRAGLAAWHAKGLHPATLPAVVHEVTVAPDLDCPAPSRNSRILTAAMARAQAAEAGTHPTAQIRTGSESR